MSAALRVKYDKGEEPVPLTPEDEAACAWLKAEIEKLSDRPMWSRSALTHRQTVHRIFVNGVERRESGLFDKDLLPEPPRFCHIDAQVLTHEQLLAITAYRQMFDGPVDLVWRVEPEATRTDEGLSIYTRLCFEPTLVRVAPGVWIEARITERDWRS